MNNTQKALINQDVCEQTTPNLGITQSSGLEWHNADIFRAGKMCGLRMVIGLWCKQPEQKSLCTLPLQ